MKNLFIGPDATTDYWITFKNLDHLRETYEKLDDPNLKLAYESLKNNTGDEISIDHLNKSYFDNFLDNIKSYNIQIESSLGGNAAIETLAAKEQNIDAKFYGALPKLNIEGETYKKLSKNFLGRKIAKSPKSFIIQLKSGTKERYILCNGQGRRANDIVPILSEIDLSKFSKDSLVGIVGIHGLFATKQYKYLNEYTQFIEDLNKNNITLYSDTGSYANYKDDEVKDLFESIYSKVNMLSINENELNRIYKSLNNQNKSYEEKIHYLLTNSNNLDTIWVHTDKIHIAISKKYTNNKLKFAMQNAAAAGTYRVEEGKPPNKEDIKYIKKNRSLNQEGITYINKNRRKYTKKYKDLNLEMIPTYNLEKFKTTVGAGDTACLTFFGSFLESI